MCGRGNGDMVVKTTTRGLQYKYETDARKGVVRQQNRFLIAQKFFDSNRFSAHGFLIFNQVTDGDS